MRIYRAAAPFVLERGVRATSMGQIARASCLSPGGIYHYFRSKTDLVLYGLEPEALSRACTEATRELAALLADGTEADLEAAVALYVEKTLLMLAFVRPALHAAIELGRPALRARLTAGLREDADSLLSGLESLHPGIVTAPEHAEAVRRTVLGLALDETITAAEAGRQLTWLFRELLPLLRKGGKAREPVRGRRPGSVSTPEPADGVRASPALGHGSATS